MDQFVSTYRHDFLWPYNRSFGKRLIESDVPNSGYEKKCKCLATDLTHKQQKPVDFANTETENVEWNRIGPMGRLLDPKLYPVKVGSSPETETMREDQPNVFMNKLQKKYPFMYEILKESPGLEYEQKVNKDRLQTTYQIDFCKADFISPHLVRAGGDSGIPPCPERISEDPYANFQKIKARRPGVISKMGQFKKKRGESDDKGGIKAWTFGNTEYQDNICKVGNMILTRARARKCA